MPPRPAAHFDVEPVLSQGRKAERMAKKEVAQKARDKLADKKGKLNEHQYPWRPGQNKGKAIEVRKRTVEGNHVLRVRPALVAQWALHIVPLIFLILVQN